MSDFRAWLEAFHAEGGDALPSQRGLSLPLAPPGLATTGLVREGVVVATPDFVTYEGIQVADPNTRNALPDGDRVIPGLRSRLRRGLVERCASSESAGELGLTIQMDHRVSWRILRDIVATARASGFERVGLALDKRSSVSSPGPSSVAVQIAAIAKGLEENASSRAAHLDSLQQEPAYREALLGSCKELAAAFFPPPELEGIARKRFQIDNWPSAVESCECKTDIEGLKALQWWWADRNSRGGLVTTSVPLRLANGEKPVRIEYAPEATWGFVIQSLQVSDDKAYYFALTGTESPSPPARKEGQACGELVGTSIEPPATP